MLGTRGTSMQREDMGSRDFDDNSQELVMNPRNEYQLHAVTCSQGGVWCRHSRDFERNSQECVEFLGMRVSCMKVVIPGNDSRKCVPLLGMGVYRICLLCGTALCGRYMTG